MYVCTMQLLKIFCMLRFVMLFQEFTVARAVALACGLMFSNLGIFVTSLVDCVLCLCCGAWVCTCHLSALRIVSDTRIDDKAWLMHQVSSMTVASSMAYLYPTVMPLVSCARMQASVLCCAVLCCAVLCCAVLCCALLCCAVLCCAVLCCAVLCCAVLCCAVLCCAVLCCAVLCCAVLCCAVLASLGTQG